MRFSQREKSRGGWVLVALVVTAFLLTTVYYREGDSGPLHVTRRTFHGITAPVAQVGAVVTSPVRAAGSWLSGITVSRSELDTLREQNATLRQAIVELEEARLENLRLRELVGFLEAREFEAVGARIIARPSTTWEAVVTIDRGTADGVETGMPVLTAHGLLGQVIEAAERSSKVRLVTDQRSGVAAMIQSTRAEGIVSGSVDGELGMEFVSRDTTLAAGDVVLTSGLGGVYPRGLFIGEVAEVELDDADLHPQIRVRSNVRLQDTEEVVVLVGGVGEVEREGGGE